MQQFKPGDIVYHKATEKRCVIRELYEGDEWKVTTQDDEGRLYKADELWTEEEWRKRNKNEIDAV